jgi:uncharacterized membrane protein
MDKQLVVMLTVIGIWIAAIVGWVMNLVTLYHMSFATITGELVLRCVGIFVAPIGSVMGFL